MKFKKLALGIVAGVSLLFGTAYSSQNNTVKAASTKQIFNRVNKHALRSYHLNQKITYHYKGKSISITQDMLMGGKKPMAARVVQKIDGKKTTAWVSDKYEYIKSGNHWYKAKLKTSTSKATAVGKSLRNSSSVLTLNSSLAKNAKVKTKGSNYIITINNSNVANKAIIKTIVQAVQRLGVNNSYQDIVNAMKINNYTMVTTASRKTYKVKKATANMNINIGGVLTATAHSTMNQIGKHNHLRIPRSIVKHAKYIPASALR